MPFYIKLLIFFIVSFFMSVFILSFFWRNDQVYQGAYESAVKNSQLYQDGQEEEGGTEVNQPRPFGLQEKDIRKKQGNRFSTF